MPENKQKESEVIDLDDSDSESTKEKSKKGISKLASLIQPIEPTFKIITRLPFIEQKEPEEWNQLSEDDNWPKLFAPEGYVECQSF